VSVGSAARHIPSMGDLLFCLRKLLTRRADVAGCYRAFAGSSPDPRKLTRSTPTRGMEMPRASGQESDQLKLGRIPPRRFRNQV